jgi:phosphate:Na+ symporter
MLLALGGLGLFLFGMLLLSDGLRALAGGILRGVLSQLTRSPLTGAVTGAVSTVLVQSSTATTVVAVGFVGAGLLTFPQSLGIIFGANVGSTVTGWLVALIGFEFGLGEAVLPLLFLAALLALFGGRRWANFGRALGGFALVFLGISFLQEGMAGLSDRLTPATLPGDSLGGRLALVLLGVAVTIITHSSAAGVAMAMSALSAGSITFPQAASLVIGMDIGTTFTAFIATIGASAAARRTGYAHVIFNLFTGAGAFLLLPLYVAICSRIDATFLASEPEFALVAFHSGFNLLGSILVLPFTGAFARLIVRLVPSDGLAITETLDPHLLRSPELALPAVGDALRRANRKTCVLLAEVIERDGRLPRELEIDEIEGGVREIRTFLERLRPGPGAEGVERPYAAAMHVLDHSERLIERLRRRRDLAPDRTGPEIAALAARLAREGRAAAAESGAPTSADGAIRALWEELEHGTEAFRQETLRRCVSGELALDVADDRLDAHRWLRRCAYHVWRMRHHLAELGGGGVIR